MPARIRLFQQGVRNHPYWWIVVQSANKNPKGRFIERLGLWQPRVTTKFVERSIVINQPRLKYWIGVGAEPTDGVLKLLEKAEVLPKRPIKHGSATLYEKPPSLIVDPKPEEIFKRYGLAAKHGAKIEADYNRLKQQAETGYQSSVAEAFSENPDSYMDANKAQIHSMTEKLSYTMDKLQGSLNTDAKRFVFWKMISQYDRPITPQRLSEEVEITFEEAEKMIESYKNVFQLMTDQDIEDAKKNLTKKQNWRYTLREKAIEGPLVVPGDELMTPYPDFGDDRENEQPYSIFETVTPLTNKFATPKDTPMTFRKYRPKGPTKGLHAKKYRFK